MTPGFMNPITLAIFLLIALLVLGPKRLVALARSLPKSLRALGDALSDERRHDDDPGARPQVVVATDDGRVAIASGDDPPREQHDAGRME